MDSKRFKFFEYMLIESKICFVPAQSLGCLGMWVLAMAQVLCNMVLKQNKTLVIMREKY